MRIDNIITSSALFVATPSFVDSTDSLSLTWKHIRISNYTDSLPLMSSVVGTIIQGMNQTLSLHCSVTAESREGTGCTATMI